MSVNAKLLLDDQEVNVLQFNFGFNQSSDATGRPSQKPIFIGLQLVIETRKDLNLVDWSFAPNETKNLELHIYPIIMGGKTRKLYFYDCHLVSWKNDFSSSGSNPISETLKITCAGVEDSTSAGVYSAYWRETFKEENIKQTALYNEKQIINYFLTNTDNEEIQDYKKNDIIILNIESQNRIGDIITINLDDAEYDFKYNGSIVSNDILKNIVISNDLEQIQLKVVQQKNKNIEKQIINYFLTNTDNEEIQDYKKNDTIMLNIESQNRIGDIITINLDDAEYNFKYNGSIVSNDILKNIVISNDLEQIKLKVVEQKSKNNG